MHSDSRLCADANAPVLVFRREEHPLVRNNGVGSMVTIVILTLFIVGFAVMCEDLLG